MIRKSLFTFALCSGLAVPGQTQEPAAQQQGITFEEFVERVRGAVNKERVQLMTQAMDFSADQASKFWPVYEEYEKESNALGDERLALISDFAENFEAMTDAKATELAAGALALEKKRTALKEKYVARISATLSPIAGARFLQAENQINMLMDMQLASRIPLIEGPQ